jgi:hypothetical protein
VRHLRAARLAYLRAFAVVSLPIWLDAHLHLLPDLLSFLLAVAGAIPLAMTVAHGVLEDRWLRRGAEVAGEAPSLHLPWTAWDDVRAGLWEGLALVSLWPLFHAAAGTPLPAALLQPLTAAAWTVLLLLAAAETLARAHGGASPGRP